MEQPAQTPEDLAESNVPETALPTKEEKSEKEQVSLITKIRQRIAALLEHNLYVIFMSIVTIYALFADDVRQLIQDKTVDDSFFLCSSLAFGLFIFEIFLSSISKPGYFLGFFFWLDLLSTASIIFDIGWLSDLIFQTSSGSSGAAGAAKLARAGRASRVGARAARIVRIVRLIRLIRIVKLYKAAHITLANQRQVLEIQEEEDESVKDPTLMKAGSSLPPVQETKDGGASLNGHDRESLNGFRRNESLRGDGLRKESGGDTIVMTKKPSAAEPVNRTDSAEAKNLQHKTSINENMLRGVSFDQKKLSYAKSKSANVIDSKQQVPSTVQAVQQAAAKEPVIVQSRKQIDNEKEIEIPQETNVGKKLSDLTTKRVITLVMSVIVSVPVFSVDTYVSDYTSGESGLRSIYTMNQTGDGNAYQLALSNYIKEHKDIRNPLISVNVLGDTLFSVENEDSLRDTEKQYYNIQGATEDQINAYSCFDLRDDTQLNAILSIVRTLFVTIVLTAAALLFNKDSNDLVLTPIENMLSKVRRIAENPLAAAQIEEEDALLTEKLEKEGKLTATKKTDQGNYETSILEKTILKLGALLALGFGEAGSDIIAQNMSESGDVNPMIPGKKVMAIFGFCDIRQFTDATEVLQEGVMVFVNEIAEIVHKNINDYSGAANKNIGDAFLLVWKFPADEVETDPNDASTLKLKQSIVVSQLADMSVIAFLKVLAEINKSKKLDKYRHNENLNQRISNYSVKMGFGLHVGWAIEGAIGSEYKIDASYLSPNVNMASRLEAATKQFGVPILISGALHKICTSETQKQLRHIDRVTVKGSLQPIDLYTCDVDYTKLTVNQNEIDYSTRPASEKRQARIEARLRRDNLREKAFSGKTKISKKFATDKDLLIMRKPFTRDFDEKFREGMENYISGNWSKARDLFETTLKMIPGRDKDGPSNTLLTYMSEFGYRAPHYWKGYRELTEK